MKYMTNKHDKQEGHDKKYTFQIVKQIKTIDDRLLFSIFRSLKFQKFKKSLDKKKK